jgi:hypothetical protein
MDSVFLFLPLAVFSGFNFLLSALISSKRMAKDFFLGVALLQSEPFTLLKIVNFSTISRVVVVLVTIVTPYVGPLMILRRLA